eukprot:gene390-3736_t
MSIIYSLVARDNQILAEYTESSGNFTTVTQSILDKVPAKNQKCTYVYDSIIYLCMTEESFGKGNTASQNARKIARSYHVVSQVYIPSRRLPFAFLAQIQRDFLPYKSRARNAITYGLNRDFSPVLQRQMTAFSNASEQDALAKAKQEIGQVKDIMVQNIDKVLQRGEQIDLLVDKADELQDNSKRFQSRSRKLKQQMWWQNKKMCMLITGVLLAIALIIGLIIWSKTKKSSSSSHKPDSTTTTKAPTTEPMFAPEI